jgi:hypothetical protein
MVGKTGFEPATPWSQTKCSTKLSYFPYINGAPDRSRTHNLLIRSQTLYPIELRAQFNFQKNGAEDRNRTGTVVTYRRILSPVRLPVPPPRQSLERKTGFEPATPTLARWCSTTELLPHRNRKKVGAGEGSRTPTPCGARS